jgi:hypothetical protein
MNGSNPPFPEALHVQATVEAAGPTSQYEKSDVSVKLVVWLAVAMAIGIAVTLTGIWQLLNYFQYSLRTEDPFASAMKQREDFTTKPRLQTHALHDYQLFAASQDSILNHYSVQDSGQQTVRIPISRAIELIAERGSSATAPLPKPVSDSKPDEKKKPDEKTNPDDKAKPDDKTKTEVKSQ